jgi:hypothetical protein
LRISGNNLWLNDVLGDTYFRAVNGSYAKIYHAGAERLSTTATGVDVTGTVTADGLTLGDNEKAIFGASSDLQIYHDGNNSIIDEVGTGNLYLRSSNLYIQNVDSDPDEMMIAAIANGAVTLSHNGAAKIATTATGVDVTGTVTADNITTTGNLSSSKVAGYGAVEVGGPSGGLIDLKAPFSDDYDARIIYNAGTDLQITTLAAGEPVSLRQGLAIKLQTTTTGVNVQGKFDATSSIAVGTAVTNGAKLTIESGQDDPSLTGTMATGHFVAQTSSGGPALNVGSDASGTWYNSAYSNNAGIARIHRWLVGGEEAMRITAAGNVGIGTATPSSELEISATTTPILTFERQDSTFGNGFVRSVGNTGTVNAEIGFGGGSNSHLTFDTNGSERMKINSSGNVGIGTAAPASIVGGTDTSPVLSIGGSDSTLISGDKAGSVSFITNVVRLPLFLRRVLAVPTVWPFTQALRVGQTGESV